MIDIDRQALADRMQIYFNPAINWDTVIALGSGLSEDAASFVAKEVRNRAFAMEKFQPDRLCRYAVRPFDTRWCYYSQVPSLWNRNRPPYWAQCWDGNEFLLSRFNQAKSPEGSPFYWTKHLSDDHFLAPDAVAFARETKPGVANLSTLTRNYLIVLGLPIPEHNAHIVDLPWLHALAIGYSPTYLEENADGIGQDWPRIPLPDSKELLIASAELGQQIAGLLDTEMQVPGVTSGFFLEPFRSIAVLSKVGGGQLQPDAGELALAAGWGHAGKDNVTMPGKGKVIVRDYTSSELESIRLGADRSRLSLDQVMEVLGEKTMDIYLNGIAYWCNIPEKVWEFTIGGYQVLKKWLSYREKFILKRDLLPEETQEISAIARRLTALCLLQPQLNTNYQNVKEKVSHMAIDKK